MPGAYFITWTCYGTWLHGDERSSVDGRQTRGDARLVIPNPTLEQWERNQLKSDPISLNAEARAIVGNTISEHCEHRGWPLSALNVRSNHVHVVVSCNTTPDIAMGQFKSWCTRRLREAGLTGPDDRVWTKHGSTRTLRNDRAVEAAVRYVMECQGESLT